MLTIPNLISTIRLFLVPVFLWLLLGRDNPAAAGWLLGGIGATDWIDGYLARRLDQVSEIGKVLDPLADRLAVAAALIGGLISGDLPAWFAIAVIVREVVVSGGALALAFRVKGKIPVRRTGKLATLLIYASLGGFLVGGGGRFAPFLWLGWIFGILGLVLYYVVAVQYVADARRLIRAGDPAEAAPPAG
jgi:cardiolipin synthase